MTCLWDSSEMNKEVHDVGKRKMARIRDNQRMKTSEESVHVALVKTGWRANPNNQRPRIQACRPG